MQIEIENLCFSFDKLPILQDASVRIRKGEFVGIIGPNGSGKTTLLKLLMGFLKPVSGKVKCHGTIGYVPQVHRTDRDFPITVRELVLLGAVSQASLFGGYPQEVLTACDTLLSQLGLTAHQHKVFGSLSGGMAQKSLLARALLSNPDVLILDEPTANIDASSTGVILELLESLKGKKTILMVTHDLRTIVERVDRVLCVQSKISNFLPDQICEHFALGLYHTPLLQAEEEHVLPLR